MPTLAGESHNGSIPLVVRLPAHPGIIHRPVYTGGCVCPIRRALATNVAFHTNVCDNDQRARERRSEIHSYGSRNDDDDDGRDTGATQFRSPGAFTRSCSQTHARNRRQRRRQPVSSRTCCAQSNVADLRFCGTPARRSHADFHARTHYATERRRGGLGGRERPGGKGMLITRDNDVDGTRAFRETMRLEDASAAPYIGNVRRCRRATAKTKTAARRKTRVIGDLSTPVPRNSSIIRTARRRVAKERARLLLSFSRCFSVSYYTRRLVVAFRRTCRESHLNKCVNLDRSLIFEPTVNDLT